MRIPTDYGPHFWAEEGWTCPTCQQTFTAILCEDDDYDGVSNGTLRCPACIDKLLSNVSRADIIDAAKRLKEDE